MKIGGNILLPDENIRPCRIVDENGIPKYFLTIYGKNKFEIHPNYRNQQDPITIEIIERGKL